MMPEASKLLEGLPTSGDRDATATDIKRSDGESLPIT